MITKETIISVAKNAKLNLSEVEIEQFQKDFDTVLDYFSILESADISDVSEIEIQPINLSENMRDDIVIEKDLKEKCLSLTRNKRDGYFRGPKAF